MGKWFKYLYNFPLSLYFHLLTYHNPFNDSCKRQEKLRKFPFENIDEMVLDDITNLQNHLKQGLIKSNIRAEQQLGVRLLSEIFRTSPERRRECLYYLALGNYRLGNYAEARRYNELLLEREPHNLQAADLRRLVDDRVAREGLVGIAIISGVAIAAGAAGAVLLKNLGRRR